MPSHEPTSTRRERKLVRVQLGDQSLFVTEFSTHDDGSITIHLDGQKMIVPPEDFEIVDGTSSAADVDSTTSLPDLGHPEQCTCSRCRMTRHRRIDRQAKWTVGDRIEFFVLSVIVWGFIAVCLLAIFLLRG